MKHKIVIFIHAITIVLLQFIPKTIILAAGVPGGGVYYHESFIYDFALLWGMGSLWYPSITVLSVITLCFSIVLLMKNLQWSKIVILSASILTLLLMLIPMIEMIKDPNQFSAVPVIIFVLLISEIIFTALTLSGISGFSK